MTTSTTKATELGYAREFTIQYYTLEQLMAMKTTTSVEQAPLEPKSLKTLTAELETAPQDDPFKVVRFDGDEHLASGRHRLTVQVHKLKRPLNTEFPCLVYDVSDRSAVNNFIVSSNTTRPVRRPEKTILLTSGSLNRMIGVESLLEDYESLLNQNNRREVRAIFLVDVLARLTNQQVPGITNTLMGQVINGLWARTFQMKSHSVWMERFFYSANNVQAYVEFLEKNLPEALVATMQLHPTVTNWARNGKDVLIGSAVQLWNSHKDTIFPDAPIPVKATTTKATTTKATTTKARSVMQKIEPKTKAAEVTDEVTVEPELVSV